MRTIIVVAIAEMNSDTKTRVSEPSRAVAQRVASETLLGRLGELVIVHNGREYRLRLTQNGKLILTA
jgi:hemin uptake protein HemP